MKKQWIVIFLIISGLGLFWGCEGLMAGSNKREDKSTVTVQQADYRLETGEELSRRLNLTESSPRKVRDHLLTEANQNPEGRQEESFILTYPTRHTATLEVTLIGLADDSVRSHRLVVEFEQPAGEWQILGAKHQWQCQEGRGHQDWSAQLCH